MEKTLEKAEDLQAAPPSLGKKPDWLKVRYNQEATEEVAALMKDLRLNTVCKEANCPNMGECYRKHTATFMILGSVCTRNCRFCNVTCGRPEAVDEEEPMNVAKAAKQLHLKHVVLTCSTRDDLEDGGALQFAKTIRAIRELCPGTTIETLISGLNFGITISFFIFYSFYNASPIKTSLTSLLSCGLSLSTKSENFSSKSSKENGCPWKSALTSSSEK